MSKWAIIQGAPEHPKVAIRFPTHYVTWVAPSLASRYRPRGGIRQPHMGQPIRPLLWWGRDRVLRLLLTSRSILSPSNPIGASEMYQHYHRMILWCLARQAHVATLRSRWSAL